nr:unnamed protein product [Digitaria exilis]
MAKISAPAALILAFFLFIFCYASTTVSSQPSNSSDPFLKCLSSSIPSQLVLTPSSPSFTPLLRFSIRNPKFFASTTVRPLYIVTPTNASHVQAAVLCGRQTGMRIRVRSGGHDYEGLSYRAERPQPFAILDLSNLRSVRVDVPYTAGMVWGQKYFRGNYQRLATAKAEIDPDDYFRNEQSIPPFAKSK